MSTPPALPVFLPTAVHPARWHARPTMVSCAAITVFVLLAHVFATATTATTPVRLSATHATTAVARACTVPTAIRFVLEGPRRLAMAMVPAAVAKLAMERVTVTLATASVTAARHVQAEPQTRATATEPAVSPLPPALAMSTTAALPAPTCALALQPTHAPVTVPATMAAQAQAPASAPKATPDPTAAKCVQVV